MKIRTRQQLIKEYIKFFKSKNHKEIPNSPLIPSNDPTVLFTTAGMHPLVPYLTGQKHPLGKRLVNVQKCIRTNDIDEVGDPSHGTFFEMLGNWSLGDYWKKEAIKLTYEYLTKVLGLKKEKLSITIFKGDKKIGVGEDKKSIEIWKSLGIPSERIAKLGKKDNWWGPAGKTGPCGPDTEMFYWTGKQKAPKKYDPKNKLWVEIGNNVFIQYNKNIRLILVDGMHCLYDKNFRINKELMEIINSFNTHTILAVNGFRKKGRDIVKGYDETKDTNWEAFSLEEEKIKKDNPKYFETLLKKFNLVPEEVIYFDHDKNNIKTAKKLGIISKHYTNKESIKKFIENNLYVYLPLSQKSVDFGGGLIRQLAVINNLEDIFQTSAYLPIIKQIEHLSNKKYEKNKKEMRIIADHIKASVFIISDGITPSNTEQGYVLRRLIRRAIMNLRKLGFVGTDLINPIAEEVFKIYDDDKNLIKNRRKIYEEFEKEEERFDKTLEQGLKKFHKLGGKTLSGKDAFLLFQSYGFPIEMTQELAKEKKIKVKTEDFKKEYEKHQKLSRTAAKGTFSSGLSDNSEKTTRLHTATHLLNEALRRTLGSEVTQRGSNITPERLRFDFNFSRKLTPEEIKKTEDLVNKKIKQGLNLIREEIPLKEALKSEAQSEFGHRYPDIVSVYTIMDKKEKKGWFSKEICTGPHVKNTKEIGRFKIVKEQSSAAGIRRIKAIIE